MAANNQIVKKSIQIDAGDTLRTVKSLKQEISDLRDELLNLEQGTEEYDEVQKRLHDDVEDLNEVMGAHKDKAEALEGSYNALQAELKELKQAWKETNDEAERDVLGKKINDLNNQLKEMDASIGDFHRNVGNYESAWNGLTSVMENGEKVTDDLEKGIKAFGTALGMSDKQVDNLSKALKSLKDGFHIAKDIAKAREETTKLGTAEKVAAAEGTALATSQKATGAAAKTMAASEVAAGTATKGLSVAMHGLKAALISTGIGALIVALGALISLLDKARLKAQSSRDAAFATLSDHMRVYGQMLQNDIKNLDVMEKKMEHNLDMAEAAGTKERDILVQRKANAEQLLKEAEEIRDKAVAELTKYEKEVENMSARQRKRMESEIKETMDALNGAQQAALDEVGNRFNDVISAGWAIELFDEKAKHAASDVTEELEKWSDLVKDQKFQAAWKGLFEMDFTSASPIETLKAQMAAATALVKEFTGDTSEVERYFNQMISEAEAEWKSLVDKEKEIFDERLTPAQRLENEKAEWVELANRWGMDSIEIVRYYDKKINEELKKAEDERDAQREAELQKVREKTQEQLDMMEDALETQEKLDELFNTRSYDINKWFTSGGTIAGDIQQDMDDLQRLYDAQMQYLNGLLESADLTEEAYAAVEERILSLTVTFNNQMNELKKEQEYQGKNFKIISDKWAANFQNLEAAAGDFADAFAAGGEKTVGLYKGFAIAQSLIAAFLAANEVLAAEPGEMFTKISAALATFAVAIGNVISIMGTNTDGSNASSMMSGGMNAAATPVIGNAQPINYTRNLTTAEEEDAMNQPIYVTVTDIEDGINGRRAQVENSSF